MSADFYEQALHRIRILTVVVGLAGTAAVLALQDFRSAAGFLLGAALSALNFCGISSLAKVLGGSERTGPVAAVLIALRYLVIGFAVYVTIKILGVGSVAVLWGLLAAFGAVLLEIFYELVFRSR
jgi:hypothetical protein